MLVRQVTNTALFVLAPGVATTARHKGGLLAEAHLLLVAQWVATASKHSDALESLCTFGVGPAVIGRFGRCSALAQQAGARVKAGTNQWRWTLGICAAAFGCSAAPANLREEIGPQVLTTGFHFGTDAFFARSAAGGLPACSARWRNEALALYADRSFPAVAVSHTAIWSLNVKR